jgi:hypothetical protein
VRLGLGRVVLLDTLERRKRAMMLVRGSFIVEYDDEKGPRRKRTVIPKGDDDILRGVGDELVYLIYTNL